jgi:hypothetical protein
MLQSASIAAPVAAAQNHAFRSATQARDIGGISLGMTIAEVRQRMQLSVLQDEQFVGTIGAVHYDLEFTPLGRVFRITTSQNLGRFAIDQQFNRTLNARLAAKYGIPIDGIEGRYWSIQETVTDENGRQRPFTSNWFSVTVLGGTDGVELNMTMLDFRYLWADRAKLNAQPKEKGENAISF